MEVLAVSDIVSQHILDETLLDRLAHRIKMKRMMPTIRTQLPEQLQSATLRRGRKREERQIRLPAPRCHRHSQQGLHVGSVAVVLDHRHSQQLPQFVSRLTGLGRMRLVDDHRIRTVRQRPDLADQERETSATSSQ